MSGLFKRDPSNLIYRFFKYSRWLILLVNISMAAAENNSQTLFEGILPEVQLILNESDELNSTENLYQKQISDALIIAKRSNHLPTIQYLYWLELKRLFKTRDKESYRKVLSEVELLPKTEDEFQTQLWVQEVAFYELDRDVNFLRDHLPLQKQIIQSYKMLKNQKSYWLETINLAKYLRLLSETIDAMNLLKSISTSVSNSFDAEVKLAFYSESGLNAYYQKNLDDAVTYFKNGLDIALSQEDGGQSAATLYSHLAMTFSDIGRNDMAIDYFNKSYEQVIASKSANELRIAKSLNNLAIAFQRDKQYDQAILYNQKSFELREKINDKLGMAFSYTNMADIYRAQGDNTKAQKNLTNALELFNEVGYLEGASGVMVDLAEVMLESGNKFGQIKALLDRSLSISKAANNRDILLKNYNALFELHKKEKKWLDALVYLEEYSALYKELATENTQKNLSTMQALYENEKQTKRISVLEQEKQLTDIELEKQKYIRYVLIAGVLLAVLFMYFIYSRYRLKEIFNQHILQKNDELSKAYEKLDLVARFDPLTNLYNRRAMSEYIKLELARIKRNSKSLSVILCDIDLFKNFNDEHGHDCGDFVLVKVAQLLNATLREQDLCCRWGGEEFLMMLPESDIAVAKLVAERLRTILNQQTFSFEENGKVIDLKISMTFGCASHLPGFDMTETIKKADEALYKGKENGRNQVVAA